jgi:hypothetical protein
VKEWMGEQTLSTFTHMFDPDWTFSCPLVFLLPQWLS